MPSQKSILSGQLGEHLKKMFPKEKLLPVQPFLRLKCRMVIWSIIFENGTKMMETCSQINKLKCARKVCTLSVSWFDICAFRNSWIYIVTTQDYRTIRNLLTINIFYINSFLSSRGLYCRNRALSESQINKQCNKLTNKAINKESSDKLILELNGVMAQKHLSSLC